jgi:preprotein translocase subunit SecD
VRRRQNQLALVVILAVTVFGVIVTWPGSPDRYLPDFIPWPSGSGIDVGGFDRDDFRLGLDLAGGVSVTLEATGTSSLVRPGESLERFAERNETSIDELVELNRGLGSVDAADFGRPLPSEINRLTLPLTLEGDELSAAVEQAKEIIDRRVSGFGVSEAEVTSLGSDRINVQIPGVTAEEAAGLVGSVALLEFRERDPLVTTQPVPPTLVDLRNALDDAFQDISLAGAPRILSFPVADPDLDVIVALDGSRWIPANGRNIDGDPEQLTGEFLIADSVQRTLDFNGQPALNFRFDDDGARLFEQITRRLVQGQEPLGIFLDGQLVSAPVVRAVISDQGVISGLSNDEAIVLRSQLRAGSLPLNLKVIQETEVSATLGEDSVVDTVQAGLVAFLAIMLFMVVYYRLPGVLGALALVVYAVVVMTTFKLVPITLTLAGIAGFVLSLGLAVDGNILIFERMREELRLGRNLSSSIDIGFNRAWPAIRDSNVSTLITVAILYFFGDQFNANLIKSFAITLFIGTIFSMVSAIFVTRTFLNLTVGLVSPRQMSLFGVEPPERDGSISGVAQPGSGD